MELEITVLDFDEDGLAVGQAPDLRVAVPGGVPGDRLLVAIEHKSPHRPHAWGRLVRILEPSRDRVPMACPNVGLCGGCLMQCASYPAQLASKQARMQRAMGGLCGELRPIVPSPRTLHYRNKAKLVVAPGVILGAYAPRTHEVIDMAGCQVTEEPIDPVARTLARLLGESGLAPYDERARTGDVRHAVIRTNHAGSVLVVIVTAARQAPGLAKLADALVAAHPEIAGVVQNINPVRGGVILGAEDLILTGAGALEDRVGDVSLRLSAQSFFQVNRTQAGALYAAVARVAELSGKETVIDVFSGTGGIARTLAQSAARVVCIESNPVAVRDAKKDAPANLEMVTTDAAAGLTAQTTADVIVVDPPRKGCEPRVLLEMARLSPRRILYVSCGPDSLARDLLALRDLGYRARTIEPYDLFPHTSHIESLSVLERA